MAGFAAMRGRGCWMVFGWLVFGLSQFFLNFVYLGNLGSVCCVCLIMYDMASLDRGGWGVGELLYALAARLERFAEIMETSAALIARQHGGLDGRLEQLAELMVRDRLAVDRQTGEFRELLLEVARYELGLRTQAVRVRFVTIGHQDLETGKDMIMPTNLVDDAISIIPLEFDNVSGQKVVPPAGTGSVVNDNLAAGSVEMSSDGMSVRFTPSQPAVDGAVGTLTFTEGLLIATMSYSVTTDPNAANVHFVTTGITTEALPVVVPPAPAPAPGP